eukprot:366371-Chlamydomonas_euryale.AAC.17
MAADHVVYCNSIGKSLTANLALAKLFHITTTITNSYLYNSIGWHFAMSRWISASSSGSWSNLLHGLATVADGLGRALHPRRVARRSRPTGQRPEARITQHAARPSPKATRPRPCPGPSPLHQGPGGASDTAYKK